MPNGCTLWPDTWSGVSISACCNAHDIAYLDGTPRTEADLSLAMCVLSETSNPLLALVMLAGVTVFGWFFYRSKKSGN